MKKSNSLKKWISLFTMICVVMMVFVGCAPKADSVEESDDLVKVNIGITPYSMYAIWAIADELELDKEFGIDIELYDFTGSAQGAQSCVRGDVDITAACVAEHLTSVVGAKNLVNFSVVGFFKGFFYVGRESDIQPWEDLVAEMGMEAAKESRINEFKGKSFCIIPQRKALILDTLAQIGLGADDVTFINFADDQKAAAAFMAGEGDFYIGSLPQQRMLLREEGYVNAGGSDILGPAGLWYDTMITTEEWLSENPETAQKVLAVFYAAVYEFEKDPAGTAQIAATYLTNISGSAFSTEEWLDMQTIYDDFQSLEEARDGFFNSGSDLYWQHSVQYQIDLQTEEGTLTEEVSATYYYGGSEKLFNDFLANQELIAQVESHK